MHGNNLFSHCPKELVTDGFLAWLFTFLNIAESEKRSNFINSLFIKNGEPFDEVENITVERQEVHIDLLVHFTSQGKPYSVLFENKTWGSPRSKQLEDYKEVRSKCDQYIYLKLAFIPFSERRHANEVGYSVITSKQLSDAIAPLCSEHLFIQEYQEYLLETFVIPQQIVEQELFEKNNYKYLTNRGAQQFILSELEEKLSNHIDKWNGSEKVETFLSYLS